MSRLLIPTLGPSDWRRLLANPSTQWVRGKSAYETAVAWEAARTTPRGLPLQVVQILDAHEDLRGASLLLGIPEHRVYFPGGGHASQTDLWALLRKEAHLISLAVEGKSGESFDKTVGKWLTSAKPNSGKPNRLAFLRERLGLSHVEVTSIRYQLLHRTASVLIEAERFTADLAVLLIQSFGGQHDAASFSDFQAFGRLFDLELNLGELSEAKVPGNPRLLLGWIACQAAKERGHMAAV
jgi:hypothetical protein